MKDRTETSKGCTRHGNLPPLGLPHTTPWQDVVLSPFYLQDFSQGCPSPPEVDRPLLPSQWGGDDAMGFRELWAPPSSLFLPKPLWGRDWALYNPHTFPHPVLSLSLLFQVSFSHPKAGLGEQSLQCLLSSHGQTSDLSPSHPSIVQTF